MPESNELLTQVFQQYGLFGLVIAFLLLGPGFTYFRTRHIRAEAESKAQTLLNEFAQRERQRSERLEARLNETLFKLNAAEDEVARLRLRLTEARSDLDEMPKLKRRIRKLTRRISELESAVASKQTENEQLQQTIQQRESDLQRHTLRIQELEQALHHLQHEKEM